MALHYMGSVPWIGDMLLSICMLTPSSLNSNRSEVCTHMRQLQEEICAHQQVCCLDTYWHNLLFIDLFVGMEAASERIGGLTPTEVRVSKGGHRRL